MLIDLVTIFVKAGNGGHGCVSLRREKFRPKGGPDGGDGGHGGHVILYGDDSLDTLLSFRATPHYKATSGRQGEGSSRTGADGRTRRVAVPLGTIVTDAGADECLGEISTDGQEIVVARGGRGGYGNEHFKSATNQTPRINTDGTPGEERKLDLELKLIADVGLIGKPNAGKSTMLRAVSRATPKVADYPFTTRSPQLGIAEVGGGAERRLVIADIPGLIEGAAAGAGLGHEFLRHIERTRVLVHVLDVVPFDGSDPEANHNAIREELAAYSSALAEKPEIIVLNKIDLVPETDRDELLQGLRTALGGEAMIASGATGEGMAAVLEVCWRSSGKANQPRWAG